MSSEIFTVIDIETTGLDRTSDHITEIAAIRTDGVRELGRFHAYVALPVGVEIPPFITELTGITTDDLAGAPSLPSALVAFWFFTRDTTWVAHNAPFDFGFIAKFHKNNERFVCTRALSKLVEPDESASLKDVCARHGIELSGHHRAINDAAATVKVLAKLRGMAEARGIKYRNIVIDSEERPLTYIPENAIVRKITKGAV